MKRTYQKPAAETVDIVLSSDVAQIVIASQTEITVNPDDDPVDPGHALSRSVNVWDEEDDNEDDL